MVGLNLEPILAVNVREAVEGFGMAHQ